jgi:putative SOS response-associated peptidase YedK
VRDLPLPALVCGRYSNTRGKADRAQARLASMLGVEQPEGDDGLRRFNIAPTQEVLAVVEEREERGGRRMERLRWGLVPAWAKEIKVGGKMINARAETLQQRPAYRHLVRRAGHRCLVLADGYYEWQKPEDPRQPRRPMHFTLADGQPFHFAGLWTRWHPPDSGEVVASCTIVTTDANEMVRPVHHRMPAILRDPEAWEAWLDPALDDEALAALLEPIAADQLTARPANPVLNSARHEGPDCLALAA